MLTLAVLKGLDRLTWLTAERGTTLQVRTIRRFNTADCDPLLTCAVRLRVSFISWSCAASYDGSLFEYFTNEAARELVHQSELRSLESFALEDKDAGRMHPDAPAARVLDVACGTGQVTIFAARDSPSAHVGGGPKHDYPWLAAY